MDSEQLAIDELEKELEELGSKDDAVENDATPVKAPPNNESATLTKKRNVNDMGAPSGNIPSEEEDDDEENENDEEEGESAPGNGNPKPPGTGALEPGLADIWTKSKTPRKRKKIRRGKTAGCILPEDISYV